MSVKTHTPMKAMNSLKNKNLSDQMSVAELIFSVLAEKCHCLCQNPGSRP